MTDESKYHTTYCRRCKRFAGMRNKLLNGRKTVWCRISEHGPLHVMYMHSAPKRCKNHPPENICQYYIPAEHTSYLQLALESKRITELKENK